MSEYSNFLHYFNKVKRNKKDASIRSDTLPVREVPVTAEDKALPDVKEKSAQTADIPMSGKAGVLKAEEDLPAARFIKTKDIPFISVKTPGNDVSSTSIEKFTDRLAPQAPEKKVHTGYTGKINTYAANHSSDVSAVKFIPADKEDKAEVPEKFFEKETPKKTASSQNKLFPEEIDTAEAPAQGPQVIVEKLNSSDKPGNTKPINAKGRLLREIAETSDAGEQLTMEGIDEENNNKEETALEKELEGIKRKKIKNFRFWSKRIEKTAENEDKTFSTYFDLRSTPAFMAKLEKKFRHLNSNFVPAGNEEYKDPSRRREIFSSLIAIRKKTIIKAMATGLAGIIILLINLLVSLSAAMNNGFFTSFGGNALIYNSVNLFFLLIAIIIMADDLKKGLFSILKMRPKTDSSLLFMLSCALLHNIQSFFTLAKPESDYHMMTGAAVLMCVPALLSKVFFYDSTRQCFKAVAVTSDKSCLRKVSDKNFAAALLMDSNSDEKNLVYSGKTRFISSFLKRSASSAFAAEASSRLVAFGIILSVSAGIAGLITSRSLSYSLSCLTFCSCLSFPVSGLLFLGFVLSKENETLSVKGSCIQSYSDARDFCAIDDIIFGDSELFTAKVISTAPASGVSVKQAQYCASALAVRTDGLIKKAFSDIFVLYDEIYPDVEDLLYESKLGFSAWIKDCRVLLGTRAFLSDHSVELPEGDMLSVIDEKNCRPLYLAIEGHFAAVFSVKYSCKKETAENLRVLTAGGTNIILSSSDPNIDEAFTEKLLSLPKNSLRIMNKSAQEKFLSNKNTITDSEKTGIVFSDSFGSLLRLSVSAVKLDMAKKFSKLISTTGIIANLALAFIFSSTGSVTGVSAWLPVLLELLWLFLCFLLPPVFLANTGVKNTVSEKTSAKGARGKSVAARKTEAPKKNSVFQKEFETLVKKHDEAENNDEQSDFVLSETSDRENPQQLKMTVKPEEKPFAVPPKVIDFDLITPDTKTEEKSVPTVSDEMIDSFAPPSENEKKPVRVKRKALSRLRRGPAKKAFNPDDDNDVSDKTSGRSILSLADEKLPPPPKYDLSKTEE